MTKLSLGVAFSGGGLKSFAQIATLYDLEKNNIDITAIAGTSMGSLIAALVAHGLSAIEIETMLLRLEEEFSNSKMLSRPSIKILPFSKDRIDGLIEHHDLKNFCEKIFEELNVKYLSDLKLPICINSVKLDSGEMVLFTNDKSYFTTDNFQSCYFYEKDIEIATAVAASCAFPFVFSTAHIDNERYVDGGCRLNCPVSLFNRNMVNKVLALTMVDRQSKEVITRATDVAIHSFDIMSAQLDEYALQEADVVFNVPIQSNYTFKFGKGNEVIAFSKNHLILNPIDYNKLMNKPFRFFNF